MGPKFTSVNGGLVVSRRGSRIRFFVVPDMLKNAPMFKRIDPKVRSRTRCAVRLLHGSFFFCSLDFRRSDSAVVVASVQIKGKLGPMGLGAIMGGRGGGGGGGRGRGRGRF